MLNRTYAYILFFLFVIISGCAHVISKDLRAKVDPSLSFGEVLQNPNVYKGKIVLWGGEIIQALPQENGTALIEVLEWPLGWKGEPQRTVSFQGRFLVLLKEPLDLSSYERGVKITVAGELEGSILGENLKSVIDRTYRYPLVLGKETHTWKDYFYPYSSPEPYADPWWYDPSHRGLRF